MHDACRLAGRSDDFLLFHLGYPELSSRYNGVGQFHRITEVATRVAGQVSGEGQSAVFREFVWRFVNIVARAVVALGQRPDYRTILKHVTNIDELCLSYAESHFADRPDVLASVEEIERLREEPPRHMAGTPGPPGGVRAGDGRRGPRRRGARRPAQRHALREELFRQAGREPACRCSKNSPPATWRNYLSPEYLDLSDPRPVWDWRGVVNRRLVVYVGLDALSDAAVAAAVGNSPCSPTS